MIPVIDVSLDTEPELRWSVLAEHAPAIRDLMAEYLRDLEPLADSFGQWSGTIRSLLDGETWRELEGLAVLLEMPFEDVLLGNLYYDALKHLWGCTAFAVDAEGGPIHGRNLDWFSETGALASATVQFRFLKEGVESYRTVGWPGFIGCLSGMAPGRFSVTLNTVISDDSAERLTPVSFLIRRTLATAAGFDEAVEILADTPVASDSMLLVTGTRPGEMAVIERTPRRSAIRRPEGSAIVVTNDYRALDGVSPSAGVSELAATSCGRFERCADLAGTAPPRTLDEAIAILKDAGIRMNITAQHMAFQPATGAAIVALPG